MAMPGNTPSYNLNGQGSGLLNPASPASLPATLPPIPPPSELLNPGVSALEPPVASVPAPSLPEVPPPHMVAPYMFAQFPKPAPPQIFQPPPPPPAAAPPPVSRQPQTPPAAEPTERKAKPSANVDKGVLTDEVIQRLNDKMNNEDANIRFDAAGDLLALLERNPELSQDPTYAPIIDAFADKIMADPNEMVRMPGLMIYHLGLDKKPSDYSLRRFQELERQRDNDPLTPDTGEADMAKDVIAKIATEDAQERSVSPEGALPQQAPPGTPQNASAPNPTEKPALPQAVNAAEPAPFSPQSAAGIARLPQPSLEVATQNALAGSPALPPGSQLDLTSPDLNLSALQPQVGQNLNIQEGVPR